MTISIVFIVLTMAGSIVPSDSIYFAAGEGGVTPFTAKFSKGQFIPLTETSENPHENYRNQLAAALTQFSVTEKVTAVGVSGKSYEVSISEHNPEADYYEPVIKFITPPDELILAATPDASLSFLPSKTLELSEGELNILSARAREIWKEECKRLPDNDKPSPQLSLLQPKVLGIKESGEMVTAVFPAIFTRYNHPDDRGTFFFLFNRKTGEIIRAHFGHPEWTAGTPDSVLNIEPRLFFRIAGFGAQYFLADFSYGWESAGYAIIDLNSGAIEALTTY